jgi:hypothetical protein
MMATGRGNQAHMRICSLTICTSVALSLTGCLTQTFGPPLPPPDAPTTSVHRAFITDHTFAADFGGLRGADALCQGEADAAGLGGGWLAWLADDTGDPTTRFIHTSAFVRLDGVTIASSFGELVGGSIENRITSTPTGQDLPNAGCWTNVSIGAHPPKTAAGDNTPTSCANWTSRDGSLQGGRGFNNMTDREWTFSGTQRCDTNVIPANHLYCFEQ